MTQEHATSDEVQPKTASSDVSTATTVRSDRESPMLTPQEASTTKARPVAATPTNGGKVVKPLSPEELAALRAARAAKTDGDASAEVVVIAGRSNGETKTIVKVEGTKPNRAVFHTAKEWLKRSYHQRVGQSFVIGSSKLVLIEPFTKNFVEAPEKAFKTTFLLRLLLGMACGVAVFPQLPVSQKKSKVLYLHGELGVLQLEDRLVGAAQGLPVEALDEDTFVQGRDLSAHLIRPNGQNAIEALVKEHKPNVLVIDPWQSFIAGFDENSFKDMSQAMEFLDRLIADYKITLFVPIHLGKDRSKGARGSSSLNGWRDARIKLEPTKDKSGKSVKVTVEPRWGEEVEPFKLRFRNGTVWSDAMFSPQSSAIRDFVKDRGGVATKEQLQQAEPWQGMKPDAFRQALSRVKQEKAVFAHGELLSVKQLNVGEQLVWWHRLKAVPGSVLTYEELRADLSAFAGLAGWKYCDDSFDKRMWEWMRDDKGDKRRVLDKGDKFKVLELSAAEQDDLLDACQPPEDVD